MNRPPLIFISAGDPSGDRNCAEIVSSILKNIPGSAAAGLGGPAMVRAGFESRFDFPRFNRMGYFEVLPELPFFIRSKNQFIRMMDEEKPDILICADYSGFNTPLMKAAYERNIPVIWYIAPMIWAWKRKKHGPRLGKYASHIACIFPFELPYWDEFTKNVSYVGNPLLEEEELRRHIDRKPVTEKAEITVAFAPGSRTMEITRILPEMIKTAELLRRQMPNRFRFRVSCTEYLPFELYEPAQKAGLELFHGSLTELFQSSDIALVTSGTSTLHAALTGIPQLILYKSGMMLYLLVKLLTKTSRFKHIGLPNIMSSEECAGEFIQHEMTAENLTAEVLSLVNNPEYYRERAERSRRLQESFGGKSPSQEIIPLIRQLTEGRK